MLLAEFFPELVRGVVLYAPTDQVEFELPGRGRGRVDPGRSTRAARPAAGRARDRAGAGDRWRHRPCVAFGHRRASVGQRVRDAAHPGQRHEVLLYPNAGHGVGVFPYVQGPTTSRTPGPKTPMASGGTQAANAAARADGYPKMLAFLGDLATA